MWRWVPLGAALCRPSTVPPPSPPSIHFIFLESINHRGFQRWDYPLRGRSPLIGSGVRMGGMEISAHRWRWLRLNPDQMRRRAETKNKKNRPWNPPLDEIKRRTRENEWEEMCWCIRDRQMAARYQLWLPLEHGRWWSNFSVSIPIRDDGDTWWFLLLLL